LLAEKAQQRNHVCLGDKCANGGGKSWELDGIAPQCAVPGLTWNPTVGSKFGRLPIPTTDPNRDFLGAHFGESYEWIFKTIDYGKPGYVNKR
jgi:hypothetical protein